MFRRLTRSQLTAMARVALDIKVKTRAGKSLAEIRYQQTPCPNHMGVLKGECLCAA